ncbi:MAG: hypothetical protein NT062_17795, partial [Proteobacteria bacterium]|nr:hypothetical protein [Pseudomonadota bacterium]
MTILPRLALLALVGTAACGDNLPPPVEVATGRLTARIFAEPAQIVLLVDGAEVWSTRRGGDGGAPNGFAATGGIAATIETQFGSYKFTEGDAHWRGITRLGEITPTPTGATFTLLEDERGVGTGELTFVTATTSGVDPAAAGFPRHVRISLAATAGEKLALATGCAADEHFVGLGGQSFDVDHHGQTVPLWVQEDGIGKDPGADDNYDGVWFLSGRRHSTHTPMPMVLSSRGYALAVDTDARALFALCSERPDTARYEAWDTRLDLQVFIGDPLHDPVADALGHMIAWVGKPARPPLSAFFPWIDAIF